MKIVYVYPVMVHRAGTERILIDKMNYLAETVGYDIVLLTHEQGEHPMPFPISPKVRHEDLNVRFFPLYKYNRLFRFFKELMLRRRLRQRFNNFMDSFSPDVVIATTYYANLFSLIDKCPVRPVRILESHIDKRYILTNDPENKKRFFKYLRMYLDMRVVNKLSSHFDLLVSLTQEDANDWSSLIRTKVIPNVVHLREDGAHTNWHNKRVVFAGRYMAQKGIPDLFQIWSLVYEKHPDWHLDLYGDGELRDMIMKEADKLQKNIHVNGSSDSILDCFCESSIFVLSSLYEPFGLVIVEAMSCGLPVVAFDCPYGPSKILKEGVEGFLIPERNIVLFANRVCQLIESYEMRMKMGRAGMISAQRYSAENIMPRWVSLFEELLKERKV